MMLGGVSGDGAAAAAAEAAETHESGGSGSSSVPGGGAIEESERSGGGGGGGGNRWPRQETLALLKIRSDMDVAFRDASLKGPLWDEVSRKMAELGFQRNPKKCKEKFENVYKYHKRTKDGRSSKPDGKSYRFFDQLEALENTSPNPILFTPPPLPLPQPPAATTMAAPANGSTPNIITSNVPSISPTPLSIVHPHTQKNPINPSPIFQPMQSQLPPIIHHHPQNIAHNFQPSSHPYNISNSTSSSSSTSSDEDIMHRRRGKKRKWKDYFERLMKEVVHKQEELHKKFLEALEKRERDRMARDEAWRVQEMARIKREHDLLLHERSISAAKDAAVIAFLQKATRDDQPPPENNNNPLSGSGPLPQPPPPPPPAPRQQPPALPPPRPAQATAAPEQAGQLVVAVTPNNGGGDSSAASGSSRWPKAEVEALISLRTRLDLKYLENGPKGPLWEEISAEMGKIGYNRSSKRCKEKWENINKYFKKVKESNKRRPEDSKTCPYFHQLEAIYKERATHSNNHHLPSFDPENPTLPIMARPEQQWPVPQEQHQQQQQQHDSVMHGQDNGSENNDHDDDDDEEEEEEDEGGGGGYEIMVNKQMSTVTNTAE